MACRHEWSTAERAGYLLKRVQSTLAGALAKALSGHGVTLAQYAVLVSLDEEPGLSNAELARRAFVTPQTMNQVLRELEARQVVLRRPHPDHGRALQTHLTPEGTRVLRGCRRAVDDVEEQMLAPLSAEERGQLVVTLRRCLEALSE